MINKIKVATDFTFYTQSVSKEKVLSKELVEESFVKELPYATLEFKEWYFEGIRIRYTKNLFKDHFLFENKNQDNVVALQFNLKGDYIIHHYGQTYITKSRQHNIIYTPGVDNTFENKSLTGETFSIFFLPEVFHRMTMDGNEVLKKFADQMLAGKPIVMSNNSPMLTIDLQKAITDILGCPFKGGLKKLFLLSKCLEILVMQAESFNKAQQENQKIIKRTEDTDRIVFVKEYLEKNMDNPPSLSELSKLAGLNEYKLKRGFKEIFNTTVFGYLTDFRLDIGKRALVENKKTISEISYDLGYSSPQHFSKAFKKKFGQVPREVRS